MISTLVLLISSSTFYQDVDPIISALVDELARSRELSIDDMEAPYFV